MMESRTVKTALCLILSIMVFSSAYAQDLSGASDPIPADERQYIEPVDLPLRWTPPAGNPSDADHYEVYLDENPLIIENTQPDAQYHGTVTATGDPFFTIDELERDTAYYWRVDTVCLDDTTIQGDVWSFATEPIDIPGVVINYSSDPVNQYCMSPSLIILPDGAYIANHEYGGPWSSGHPKQTLIFRSDDQGRSWRQIGLALDQYWSSTFYHDETLYLMGIDGKGSGPNVTIRRSDDLGYTWTDAEDETTGVLMTGQRYHTGPVPVAVHNGRIWRAMEDRADDGDWGYHFRAFVMSAPLDSDLLDAASWTATPPMSHDEYTWRGTGWLEGNAVLSPDGEMLNILRVSSAIPSLGTVETAAVMHISGDGTQSFFDPESDFIDMPGGGVKFVIRFDDATQKYWILSNQQKDPWAMRNRLVLCSSEDLLHWTNHGVILKSLDPVFHAWQYVDWRIDGDDMVFVSRTAHPMGHGVMPHGYHDANFFTFHRIPNFRDVLDPDPDDDADDDLDDDFDDDANDDVNDDFNDADTDEPDDDEDDDQNENDHDDDEGDDTEGCGCAIGS